MSRTLLELPAKRGRLHALAAAGILDEGELERGLADSGHRPASGSWSRYLYWHALIVGVVLLVAGTIFFVAANWSALSGLARMAIVGGAMVGATLVGGGLGDTLAGRAATLLGGLLFGPLVAVYAQVYQTGADPWQLFAWWSLVLLAYGVLARFVGTWVLALLCVHIACFTWIDQELGVDLYKGLGAYIVAGLALLDAVVVGVTERLCEGRERDVMARVAALFGLGLVLPFGVITLVDEPPVGSIPGLVVLVAALVGIWLVYRWRRPDVGMLAAFATVVTILVTSLFARILFEEMDAELFGVAALGVVVCGMVWGFTRWLLAWRREHPPAVEPVAEEQP